MPWIVFRITSVSANIIMLDKKKKNVFWILTMSIFLKKMDESAKSWDQKSVYPKGLSKYSTGFKGLDKYFPIIVFTAVGNTAFMYE